MDCLKSGRQKSSSLAMMKILRIGGNGLKIMELMESNGINC